MKIMPYKKFQEAINWLENKKMFSEDNEERLHCNLLCSEIVLLLNVYNAWFAHQQYQNFIAPRNELAKQLLVALHQGKDSIGYVKGEPSKDGVQKCLMLADTFLEVSGEKKKSQEEIEKALREVLGWKK